MPEPIQRRDAEVLSYLTKIYAEAGGDDLNKFIDRIERAKLLVQRDLLEAEVKHLRGESSLKVVKESDAQA